jgi:predicted TIM-barrel fold metal-dependent hydrolase
MTKTVDLHCHVLGKIPKSKHHEYFELARQGSGMYYFPDDNLQAVVWLLGQVVELELTKYAHSYGVYPEGRDYNFDDFMRLTICNLGASSLDGAVLLALDAFWNDGVPDEVRTDIWVPNQYLWEKIQNANADDRLQRANKRLLFGASISPNRPRDTKYGWQRELDWVASCTEAVLLKLIPSVQNVELRSKTTEQYWRAVASTGLPVLIHVGGEYAFPEGQDPKRRKLDCGEAMREGIRRALDCGVTVVAAHCGAPLFFKDQDCVDDLRDLMHEYNRDTVRLWADNSALTTGVRMLSEIPKALLSLLPKEIGEKLQDLLVIPNVLEKIPQKYMLHGSDFPVPVDSALLADESIKHTKNWLDRDILLKQSVGFDKDIPARASQVLRLVGDTKKWFDGMPATS